MSAHKKAATAQGTITLVPAATDGAAAAIQKLLNRRAGYLIHLSESEKLLLREAAGAQPLAAYIRDAALAAAHKKLK